MTSLTSNVGFFLLFIIPGFITIKVVDSLRPFYQRTAFQETAGSALCGLWNFFVFQKVYLSVLQTLQHFGAFTPHVSQYAWAFLALFVGPIAWGIGFVYLARSRLWQRLAGRLRLAAPGRGATTDIWTAKLVDPNDQRWVIARLKTGTTYCGVTHQISDYPYERALLLGKVYLVDENRQLIGLDPERSEGVYIRAEDVEAIELYD